MSKNLKNKIKEKLKGIPGEVITEENKLALYSRDQSIYEILPLAAVIPANVEDIIETIKFAYSEGIPVTPRSGGSGTAGAALGKGIIISFPRKGTMNKILNFQDNNSVTAEAGIIHDNLQKFLRSHGMYLPADPSSGAISLIGGNVSTKASGPHALRHGSIDRLYKKPGIHHFFGAGSGYFKT